MAPGSAERLPGLEKKLRILYAYTGLKQATLAGKLGRAESTVHDWIHGSELKAPELVPAEGRELLAKLLVDTLGTLSIERARALWLGPFDAFARAFAASTEEGFLELLSSVERTPSLTYLPDGLGDLQLVNFGRRDSPGGPQIAFVGDEFALRVSGSIGAHVVLIVETVVGRHLGIPRPGLAGTIPSPGVLRLPEDGCWSFDPPGGLHRFLLFVLERDTTPAMARLGDILRPLGPDDIKLLIDDLTDKAATRNWHWDLLAVDVRPKP